MGGEKQYIGSAVDFDSRKRCHLFHLRSGTHKNNHLQNAFNKHGESMLLFSVLEESELDLIPIEQKWIESFDFGMLYNIATVASASFTGKSHSPKTKKMLSDMRNGKPRSKQTKEKIAKSLTGTVKSADSISKQIDTRRQKYGSNAINSKSVVKICCVTGEYLEVYQSISDAAGGNRSKEKRISAVCNKTPAKSVNGKQYTPKTVSGFKWKFV